MDEFVKNINYRDFSFAIYKRDRVYYTILAGKEILAGTQDNYEICIKRLIDKFFDCVVELDDESWLEWFDNGTGRDIRLVNRDRILKIFLISDPKRVDLDKLTKLAADALHAYRHSNINKLLN